MNFQALSQNPLVMAIAGMVVMWVVNMFFPARKPQEPLAFGSDERVNTLTAERDELHKQLMAAKSAAAKPSADTSKLEAEIKRLQEETEGAYQQVAQYRLQAETLSKQLESAGAPSDEVPQLRQLLEEATAERDNLRRSLVEAQVDVPDTSAFEQEIASLKQQLAEADAQRTELDELRAEVTRLKMQTSSPDEAVQAAQRELESMREQFAPLQLRAEQAIAESDQLKQRYAEVERRYLELRDSQTDNSALDKAIAEAEALRRERHQLIRQAEDAQARYNELLSSNSDERVQKVDHERAELEKRLTQMEREREQLRRGLALASEVSEENLALKRQVEELRSAGDTTELQNRIAELEQLVNSRPSDEQMQAAADLMAKSAAEESARLARLPLEARIEELEAALAQAPKADRIVELEQALAVAPQPYEAKIAELEEALSAAPKPFVARIAELEDTLTEVTRPLEARIADLEARLNESVRADEVEKAVAEARQQAEREAAAQIEALKAQWREEADQHYAAKLNEASGSWGCERRNLEFLLAQNRQEIEALTTTLSLYEAKLDSANRVTQDMGQLKELQEQNERLTRELENQRHRNRELEEDLRARGADVQPAAPTADGSALGDRLGELEAALRISQQEAGAARLLLQDLSMEVTRLRQEMDRTPNGETWERRA